MSRDAAADLLSWEDLGTQPSGRAFRRSLAELLRHPAAFYRRMALTGGLHEPVAFFAVALGAVIVLAFPAALAYYLLMGPDPARMPPEVYARYVLVTQGTGVALVLLPVALAVGAGAMVLLGTVFHLAGKPFGTGNWEGSVSVCLYAGAGALVPLAAALVLLLLVSLAGCLLGVPAEAAHWTLLGGVGAALVAGALLLFGLSAVGCAEAFELEPVLGAAAAFAGVVAAAAVACAGGLGIGWPAALCAFALAGLAVAALRRGGD